MYCDAEVEHGVDLQKDWELMQVVLPRYFAWARDNDNFDEIVSLEMKFDIDLDGHKLIGYIDGIVRIGQSLWILEHKFLKAVSTSHIDVDAQISLYILAANRFGYKVRGVLYNVIRVAEGGIAQTQPVARVQVYRNPEGLRVIEREAIIQMEEMEEFHEKGGRIYRNPTKDCSWDCGFFQTCLSINDDGNVKAALDRLQTIIPDEEEDKVDGGQSNS
jgi:hypothetical protein